MILDLGILKDFISNFGTLKNEWFVGLKMQLFF